MYFILFTENYIDKDLTTKFKVQYNSEMEAGTELSDHFGQMLAYKEFSDVEIHCNGTVFPCHQIILATRSSVFRAMLSAEMLEAQTKRIVIKDSRPEIVGEMLRFIYTGDIPDAKLASSCGHV